MASFPKLVFLFTLVSSLICIGSAAPLRARPRDAPSPAATPTALTLKAQQDSFTFDLSETLALPASSVQPLAQVPPNCATYNSLQSECPTYFEAVNVTYDDCGDAWTVCRCSTANMTMDTAVERLGRIPVGLRRYVATVIVAPDLEAHAYTLTSGEIHMFGDTAVDSWVHEAAHAFDWATGTPLSGTPEWLKAIESDSCVPDTYSATGANEDFAQVTVMKVYSLIHGNSLPDGWSLDCMSNQMDYMSGLSQFNKAELFGNTCAIAGSDPFSRHSAPPPVTPTRVLPDFPAQVQPNSPLKSILTAPVVANEATTPNRDNAASTYIADVKLVLFVGGAIAGWSLW
ncbi:hypothetical protein FPV67DRAFT_1481396 [Lyophyllum atratum]|nr:hypothetical protein FPV67DRAFT_1481396 [Lyophyllum atratum]